jgi:hypothetical protein
MTELEILQSFHKNPDGSWSCITPVSIEGISLDPGAIINRGTVMSELEQLAEKHPQFDTEE